jgi:uncharacterized protein YdeI (YjbR/CyaY-like superfamily)
MSATFFSNASEFRAWLEENHLNQTELLVGFYTVKSGLPSMTWPESVDEALCFGWIDGVRRSIDKNSYSIRFTPRRDNSIWSLVNIAKVENLIQKGLMKPEGLAAFAKCTEEKSRSYVLRKEGQQLSEPLAQLFKANTVAWDFFNAQAPSYQKTILHWIMSAKQEKTQLSRLEKTIAASEIKKRLQ